MAKIEITEEERRAASYLDWSDESIGMACKGVAEILRDGSGKLAMKATGAAVFLIAVASDCDSSSMTLEVEGASCGEKQFGDWKITVERMNQG